MIFVSFGSHNQRFDRLALAIDEFAKSADEKVVVQYGFTEYPFKYADGFDYCTKDEMAKYFKQASILVLQGGWGSISEAIEKRKRIVVVPRIDGVEHIHDQKQLVVKLEKLQCVLGVYEISDLRKKISEAKTYDFKGLARGNASGIIKEKLNEWFN